MSHLNLSEEEADAEIERMQQRLTLALQEIDENIASCNQNTSKLSAEIDLYGEASRHMRKNSQKWLYFLKTMLYKNIPPMSEDGTSFSTNRPTLDEDTTRLLQRDHDMSNSALTGSIRKSLRNKFTSPMDTTLSGPPLEFLRYQSPSTLSNTSSNNRLRMSPPRTVPFGLTSEQLQGTPIREQAMILTEHTLRRIGAQSDSDSDSGPYATMSGGGGDSHSFYSRSTRARESLKRVYEDTIEGNSNSQPTWETSIMNTENTQSRFQLKKFLEGRNVQVPSTVFKQPYLPRTLNTNNNNNNNKRFRPEIIEQQQQQQEQQEQEDMIGSNRSSFSLSPRFRSEQPEVSVSPFSIRQKQDDLRFSPRFSTEIDRMSPRYLPEEIQSPRFIGIESNISPRFQAAVTPTPMQQEEQEQEEQEQEQEEQEEIEVAAYEFSDGLPNNNDNAYNETRMQGSTTSSSIHTFSTNSITSKDSTSTSNIPRNFDLTYFPDQFRNPPNSSTLTKIFNEFNKRPGTLLTLQDVLNYLDDTSYSTDLVSLCISLLTRKNFIKRVGDKDDAWVVRR